jgi:hypothetical protein
MRRRKTLLGLTIVVGMIASGCSGATGEETLPSGTAPRPEATQTVGSLVEFDACEDFLDYVIGHALDLVGPYGLEGFSPWPWITSDSMMALEETAEPATDAGAGEFSGTNVQVEGVDEPDIVKTDGERIALISEGELIVADVTGEEPEIAGRLTLRDLSVQSLFLSGDRVLLFGSVWNQGPIPLAETDAAFGPVPASPLVQITEVDISGEPEIDRTMTIDGSFISGRMVDESVRLVLTSGPVGFEWSYPEGSGLRAEREATERNRQIVRDSTEENWIPYHIVTDSDGEVTSEGMLFDCDRATHPQEFSGLGMLSVVTIDLSKGLDVTDATGVLATGETIYSSTESLYVATQKWDDFRWLATGDEDDRPDGPTTDIHKFDASTPEATTYLASGSVEGYLLNQFAMDEHRGVLRVASTTTPGWWGSGTESESRVTILDQVGGELVAVGMVDGLGETEQIYSVRFMGDIGYVVTFRRTDPLYTLDLANPRQPEVVGELKIPGYSAYLHPLADGLLMGVGQDATDEGQVRGTQVSVFDVGDLSDPKRIDTYTLGEGTNSQVEYDHHAFLYWDDLAVIPVQQWWWDDAVGKEEAFMGAVGLRVGENGELSEVGTIVHPGGDQVEWDWRAQVLRSIAIGESLYTISAKGILQSDLESLEDQAWLDF